MRIITTLILAVAAYFGATYWVELQNPEVAKMTSDPLKKVAKESDSKQLSQFVGTFKINTKLSSDWLNNQTHLSHSSRAHFAKNHQEKTTFTYDGSKFYFGENPELAGDVEVISENDNTLELRLLDTTVEHEGSLNFYLQSADNGQVWYSNYSHMQAGKRQLYRACYSRQ